MILPRMNNFNIKQKRAWNTCFILWHQDQTRSRKIKANKPQQISVKTQVLVVKTELHVKTVTTTTSKSFYIIFVDIFFSKHEPMEKLIEFEFS